MSAELIDIEDARSARMPRVRYGGAELLDSGKIKIVADAELEPGAARTFAHTILRLADAAESERRT